MNILQEVLFPFEELVDFSPYEGLEKLFEQINYSPLQRLENWKYGRKGHNKVAMLKAFVAKDVLQINTTTELYEAIRRDIVLRLLCGFFLGERLPSLSTFSRFYAALTETPEVMNEIFDNTLKKAISYTSSQMQVAIDSTDIEACESVRTNKKKNTEENNHAQFGHRTASAGKNKLFYGYKVHTAALVTDEGPLPLGGLVAPANISDMELAPHIMEMSSQMHEDMYGTNLKYFLMDAGYDAHFVYEKALELNSSAIVCLNKRGSKKTSSEFTDDGTPICPGQNQMIYWGTDKKRLINKFRCAKAVGKDITCNRECNCSSSYGKVTNVSIRNNPRLFNTPHRGSKQWKELYNLRWHVERLFNVLKNKLNLAQVTVRGLSKVTLHVNICNLAYVAGTVAMLKQKAIEKAA